MTPLDKAAIANSVH